jgi:hypothetical protein
MIRTIASGNFIIDIFVHKTTTSIFGPVTGTADSYVIKF